MTRHAAPEILEVTAENVEKNGFFCYMSKKKSEGYRRKLNWLKSRFAEGLRIKMLALPDRGFIEYIPGERAWRAVHADGYLLIHCLWVVGCGQIQGPRLRCCVARRVCSGRLATQAEGSRRGDQREGLDGGPWRVREARIRVRRHCFAGKWEEKARALGKGLRIVQLESRDDVLRLSPSPYGVFGLVLDGRLLSYHYQLEKDLLPLLSGSS